MYQNKNYSLSWIGNARGDIQELVLQGIIIWIWDFMNLFVFLLKIQK